MSIPLNSNLVEGIDRGDIGFILCEEKNEVRSREEGDDVELADGWDEEKIAPTSWVK